MEQAPPTSLHVALTGHLPTMEPRCPGGSAQSGGGVSLLHSISQSSAFSALLHTVKAGLMVMKKACWGFETSNFDHVYLCANEFQCALETNKETKMLPFFLILWCQHTFILHSQTANNKSLTSHLILVVLLFPPFYTYGNEPYLLKILSS